MLDTEANMNYVRGMSDDLLESCIRSAESAVVRSLLLGKDSSKDDALLNLMRKERSRRTQLTENPNE